MADPNEFYTLFPPKQCNMGNNYLPSCTKNNVINIENDMGLVYHQNDSPTFLEKINFSSYNCGGVEAYARGAIVYPDGVQVMRTKPSKNTLKWTLSCFSPWRWPIISCQWTFHI